MNKQFQSFINASKKVKLNDIKTHEYKLMYMFGAWVTAEVIIAECDDEAIFDAEEHAQKLKNWKNGVALFCGNRLVHKFK
jgi:hypothetical protein